MTSPWRAIPGYPGYEITPRGLVRTTNGYTLARRGSQVRLTRDGERVTASVAALLDLAFPATELIVASPASREARQIAALKRAVANLAARVRRARDVQDARLTGLRSAAKHRADLLAEITRMQGRIGELARAALAAERAVCPTCEALRRENHDLRNSAQGYYSRGIEHSLKAVEDMASERDALRTLVAELRAELAVYRVGDSL